MASLAGFTLTPSPVARPVSCESIHCFCIFCKSPTPIGFEATAFGGNDATLKTAPFPADRKHICLGAPLIQCNVSALKARKGTAFARIAPYKTVCPRVRARFSFTWPYVHSCSAVLKEMQKYMFSAACAEKADLAMTDFATH